MRSFPCGQLAGSLFFASCALYAQGVGASGEISGSVRDPSLASVPRASITATETSRGFKYTALTNTLGLYWLSGLPPGAYDLSTRATGFATQIRKGVVVSVGGIATADFHLSLADVTTEIEVTDEPPLVETREGKQADALNDAYIDNLPVNRRDYLTFSLLLPGVSDSTRVADDQDFRVKQTPQSGLSFYGSNGRGNNVTVNGGDTGDDSGGVRLTVTQEAVQEFQVNRSNYSAELGAATGASVNIVTKSGTNETHGSGFGYFRNDAMDARDPFAFSQALQPGQTFNPANPDTQGRPLKDSLSRQQYGGSIGFPIAKNRTFLFAAFEGLRQNAQNAAPLLTDTNIFRPQSAPENNQAAIISALANDPGSPRVPCLTNPDGSITSDPAATCAALLGSALTISPFTGLTPTQTALNGFLVNDFEDNGGVFAYDTRQYLASVRLDRAIDEANNLLLHYRYGHDVEEAPDTQSLTGYSAGSAIRQYDSTIEGAWFHVFSPMTQNELRAQWSYSDFDVTPNAPAQVSLQIAGYANGLGTNLYLPNYTIRRREEMADNITMNRGTHNMKFGVSEVIRGNHSESHTYFSGRFSFGSLPGATLSPCLGDPVGCGLSGALNPVSIDSLQAASLGLPQVFQQGFGNPIYAHTRPFTAAYWQDSWLIGSRFTLNYGLRYELDTQFAPLKTDKDDLAPRISFAWAPFEDRKTVIRGGYGLFYGLIDYQIPAVDYSLGALNGNSTAVENQGSANQVTNLTTTCGMAGVFPGSGKSPCYRPISLYVDPLTPTGLPLQNSAVAFQTLFAQGKIQCTTPSAGNAACITPADVAQFGIDVANSGPVSPLTVLFVNQPNYRNPYSQQASLGIERQIGTSFSIAASYVYVHTLRIPVALDTNLLPAPYTSVTLANGQTATYRNWNTNPALGPTPSVGAPQCAGDLLGAGAGCFVNPLIPQNNQYSSAGSALYQGGLIEIKKRFSKRYLLMLNYTYSKAIDTTTDFNSDYGPQDPTNLAADRAVSDFDERHKVVAAGVFSSPWRNKLLAGFEMAPIFQYHSGHPFNLLAGEAVNGDNHTTNGRPIGAGRNTGLGPNYASMDLRLSRRWQMKDKTELRFTAEAFNLFNRTNYASVNNEVGPDFGLPASAGGQGFTTFQVPGSAALSPSQPLGFTSAFAKRQIQLGVRLSF